MSGESITHFQEERERLNDVVMRYAGLNTKRFYNLDSQVYRDGALSARTKELLGLVASIVLRCDDCVKYHLVRSCEEGLSSDELEEALAVGLVVGGSITIPHLRRAFEFWGELEESGRAGDSGEK
jgi:AhpD family alkylhydroperoxidase